MIDKSTAIQSLRPGAEWVLRGDELEWVDEVQSQPTESEIAAEILRLESVHELTQYQRDRAIEYPPITEYIDGVVKGDQEKIQAYIDACLAVKAKYPKPEGI
jgi:hypothetical protein